MSHKILITKHIYPEAVDYLRQRTEIEYHDSDESCAPEELLARDASMTKPGAVRTVQLQCASCGHQVFGDR